MFAVLLTGQDKVRLFNRSRTVGAELNEILENVFDKYCCKIRPNCSQFTSNSIKFHYFLLFSGSRQGAELARNVRHRDRRRQRRHLVSGSTRLRAQIAISTAHTSHCKCLLRLRADCVTLRYNSRSFWCQIVSHATVQQTSCSVAKKGPSFHRKETLRALSVYKAPPTALRETSERENWSRGTLEWRGRRFPCPAGNKPPLTEASVKARLGSNTTSI